MPLPAKLIVHLKLQILFAALAVLAAAPLPAQVCSWEDDRPKRGRAAAEDSVSTAIRESQRAAIVRAAAAAGVTEPRGIVAISVGRTGADPTVRVIDANFPASALDSVRAGLVAGTRLFPGRRDERLVSVVRLDTLPLPAARADGKRRECRPMMSNQQDIARELTRSSEGAGAGRAVVAMLVDRDGRVRHAEIMSRSASARADAVALRVAARSTFRPATVDGVRRDVWVTLPITFP